MWTTTAVTKYRRIGFVVADARGEVWRLTSMQAEQRIGLWKSLVSYVWTVRVRACIEVEKVESDPTRAFREALLGALEKADDSLTQFHSREKIANLVSNADSVSELVNHLCRMKVITTA